MMDGYYVKDKYYPRWLINEYEQDAWYSDNLNIFKCDDGHYHWEIWGHNHVTGKKSLAMSGTKETFDEASTACVEMVNAMSALEEPHEPIRERLN